MKIGTIVIARPNNPNSISYLGILKGTYNQGYNIKIIDSKNIPVAWKTYDDIYYFEKTEVIEAPKIVQILFK